MTGTEAFEIKMWGTFATCGCIGWSSIRGDRFGCADAQAGPPPPCSVGPGTGATCLCAEGPLGAVGGAAGLFAAIRGLSCGGTVLGLEGAGLAAARARSVLSFDFFNTSSSMRPLFLPSGSNSTLMRLASTRLLCLSRTALRAASVARTPAGHMRFDLVSRYRNVANPR